MTAAEKQRRKVAGRVPGSPPGRGGNRWTLMLLRYDGETRIISRFKGLLIIYLLLLLAALTAAGYFFTVYSRSRAEVMRLSDSLAAKGDQLIALQQEKDRLIDKRVSPEPQNAADVSSPKPKTPPKAPAPPGKSPATPDKSPPAAALTAAAPLKKQPGTIEDQPEAGTTPPKPDTGSQTAGTAGKSAVAAAGDDLVQEASKVPAPEVPAGLSSEPAIEIEGFKIHSEPQNGRLKGQFKLINTTADKSTIAGYAFVLLKNPALPQDRWLTYPRAELSSRRPLKIEKGRRFSIVNYMRVRFKIYLAADTTLADLKTAEILVYGEAGALIAQKSLAIDLQ